MFITFQIHFYGSFQMHQHVSLTLSAKKVRVILFNFKESCILFANLLLVQKIRVR